MIKTQDKKEGPLGKIKKNPICLVQRQRRKTSDELLWVENSKDGVSLPKIYSLSSLPALLQRAAWEHMEKKLWRSMQCMCGNVWSKYYSHFKCQEDISLVQIPDGTTWPPVRGHRATWKCWLTKPAALCEADSLINMILYTRGALERSHKLWPLLV